MLRSLNSTRHLASAVSRDHTASTFKAFYAVCHFPLDKVVVLTDDDQTIRDLRRKPVALAEPIDESEPHENVRYANRPRRVLDFN
jgi:hypothetical protein